MDYDERRYKEMNKNLETFIEVGEDVLLEAYSNLNRWNAETEEYRDTVKNIRELADLHLKAIEIGIKEEQEKEKIRIDDRKIDMELNNQIAQLESDIKNQMIQLAIGAGLQFIGIVNYDLVYFSGLNFEKTGTPCSKFFNTVIQRSSDLLKLKK